MQIVCYHGAHYYWSYCVALPGIIVWGLGIPLFALALLARSRNELKTLKLKQELGFLYNGYKIKYYYWEIFIMYRKVMMVVIAVIFS